MFHWILEAHGGITNHKAACLASTVYDDLIPMVQPHPIALRRRVQCLPLTPELEIHEVIR